MQRTRDAVCGCSFASGREPLILRDVRHASNVVIVPARVADHHLPGEEFLDRLSGLVIQRQVGAFELAKQGLVVLHGVTPMLTCVNSQ